MKLSNTEIFIVVLQFVLKWKASKDYYSPLQCVWAVYRAEEHQYIAQDRAMIWELCKILSLSCGVPWTWKLMLRLPKTQNYQRFSLWCRSRDQILYDLLLQRLEFENGTKGPARAWFCCYLAERCQHVKVNFEASVSFKALCLDPSSSLSTLHSRDRARYPCRSKHFDLLV